MSRPEPALARNAPFPAVRAAGQSRVGYLVNQYPAVSHGFIRREIAGLEWRGLDIRRYSIRQQDGDLPHPADRRELALTQAVLAQPKWALIAKALWQAAVKPVRFARCLSRVLGITPGKHRWVRAAAFVVEAFWLAGALRREGIQHLHAHFGTDPAAVARLAADLAGIPDSFAVHGPDEFDAPDALGLADKVNDAAFVAAICSFGRSQLLRHLRPSSWPKVKVVRCGLDFAYKSFAGAPQPIDFDFCFVGRLAPQKGLPTLAQALADLKQRGALFTIAIIGEGEIRGWLREFVAAHGLGNGVHLLDTRTEQEVFETMSRSRTVVVPSYAEGLRVLMEAFASRRPVVYNLRPGDTGAGHDRDRNLRSGRRRRSSRASLARRSRLVGQTARNDGRCGLLTGSTVPRHRVQRRASGNLVSTAAANSYGVGGT